MKKNNILIIAEAGVNHNGKLSIAKKLVDIAVKAKANIIKFQSYKTENIVSKNLKKANYQKKFDSISSSQFDMLTRLELSEDDQYTLFEYCNKKKIQFLSTPFDLDSFGFLKKLNLGIYKVPSGEITNIPLLRAIGAENKKVIISTGMSNMKEIKNAIDTINKSGTKRNKITLLHCTTEYPARYSELNLNAMHTLKKKFNVNIGYSDHSNGIEVSIAAAAMGAKVIEKHFTFNQNAVGPDHKASLNPNELTKMVKSIRNVEISLGSFKKEASNSEKKNIMLVRKYIVASTKIKKGEKFTHDNITTKRTGRGISAAKWDQVLGKKSKKNYLKDMIISD